MSAPSRRTSYRVWWDAHDSGIERCRPEDDGATTFAQAKADLIEAHEYNVALYRSAVARLRALRKADLDDEGAP